MDRLRRLDSLFAERVLGLSGPFFADECTETGLSEEQPCGCRFLPNYTRSFDEAWHGSETVCRAMSLRLHPELKDPTTFASWSVYKFLGGYCACLENSDESEVYTAQDSTLRECWDHPAEALVLACLRAVGCSEDELK